MIKLFKILSVVFCLIFTFHSFVRANENYQNIIVNFLSTCNSECKRKVFEEEINSAFKHACENELKGIMQYTEDPIVGVDVIGNPHSVLFDAEFTSMVGNLVKVIGWYDNEWGYSNRLVDLILKMG